MSETASCMSDNTDVTNASRIESLAAFKQQVMNGYPYDTEDSALLRHTSSIFITIMNGRAIKTD